MFIYGKERKINFVLFFILIFFTKNNLCESSFGGWSVSEDLFNFVREVLPEGSTMLELGSGKASSCFSEFYTVYSIEHDRKWLNRYNTNYIYAPIKNRWYSVDVLKNKLPKNYDLILIDGPPGKIGRSGFLKHLELFNIDAIMIFDDLHRAAERNLFEKVAQLLSRPYFTKIGSDGKTFGVIEGAVE